VAIKGLQHFNLAPAGTLGMNRLLVASVLVAIMVPLRSAQGQVAGHSDRMTIVGSSTVYPFSKLVAEHFARSGPFPAPIVRSTGTAEGFRLFCTGAGAETPDISNASRPMSEAERGDCIHNGVVKIAAIRIGYDSLVLANSLKAEAPSITLDHLWRAAAAVVPIGALRERVASRHNTRTRGLRRGVPESMCRRHTRLPRR
jgi:phosphate transport system substrate-binding protein